MANEDEDDAEPGGDNDGEETYHAYLEEQRRSFRHHNPDSLLAIMASPAIAQHKPWLTVLIGGTWISGQAATYADWLAAHGAILADQESADFYREWALEAHAEDQVSPVELEDTKYLHLVQTETVMHGGIHVLNSPLRCRLTSVDAWMRGKMTVADRG